MKLTDSNNFAFGEVIYSKPASREDLEQGIDAWLGGLPFAWRRRRVSIAQYGEISIRAAVSSGGRTEYHKLMDGSFKAQLYVFQFLDAVVVCRTVDIIQCLHEQKYTKRANNDGLTAAIYIKLAHIPHLVLAANYKDTNHA